MNELIRTIAEQTFYCGQLEGDGVYTGQLDLEKFAELIVQECIQVLKDTGYPNAHGNCVGVEEIKQHFGVDLK